MKLTVLVDNNTLIDRYFIGEPGLSYYIEEEDKKILFDVGYSDAFIKNGRLLDINFKDIDMLVLSHSHLDHTWGLEPLIRYYTNISHEGIDYKNPQLITHPYTLNSRKYNNIQEIGSLISEEKLDKQFQLNTSKEPVWLTEKLVFLGEIERINNYEAKTPIGKIVVDDKEEDDYIIEDTALAYKTDQGLVIITGCSHAGICNIVEKAKKVCKDDRVVDIIGGLHLQNPSKQQLIGTVEYMKKLNPETLHACHCTDLKSKIELSKVVNVEEVGVGLVLNFF